MPKILLLSDTHAFLDPRIEKYAEQVDQIWHAGDIGDLEVIDALKSLCPDVRAVHGNIDGNQVRSEIPEHQHFEVEGAKIWMTHIGGYPPKYNTRIKAILQQVKPDLFICGHSHILKVIYDPALKCLHMNPGAAGKHGFHNVQTLIQFKIETGEVKDLKIIELKK